MRIESGAQGCDWFGQRIREVFVFTPPETMSRHDDVSAEMTVVRVERGYPNAFVWCEKFRQERPTMSVEVLRVGPGALLPAVVTEK